MHIVIFAGQSRPPDTFSPPNPPTKKQAPTQTLKTSPQLLLNTNFPLVFFLNLSLFTYLYGRIITILSKESLLV